MIALTILTFIVVLGILVLVHELGHFLTARKFKMGVDEFGIGFPPRLTSTVKNGVRYSLNLLPLGGFVKIKGEDGEHENDEDSFSARPVWQRIIVIIAGVTMNIFAGWLILVILFSTGAPVEVDSSIPTKYVHDEKIVISELLEKSPADEAGLEPGDQLISIDGLLVDSIEHVQDVFNKRADQETELEYERDGARTVIKVVSEQLADSGTDRAVIGIALSEIGVVKLPITRAIIFGSRATYSYLTQIVEAFVGIFKDIARGAGVNEQIGGPVAIAVRTSDVLDLGLPYILIFTAVLSFNLAILNILPFPALDGGRLLFLLIEAIRRKPSKQEVEAWFHRIGFALLMVFVIFITYRDITRFGGRIWNALIG